MLSLIYAISVQDGDLGVRYHIGRTTNLNYRLSKFLVPETGKTSLRIDKVIISPSDGEVGDELTAISKEYTTSFGAENVIIDPPEEQKPCCTRCGRNSHTAVTCFARTTLDGSPLALSSAATLEPASTGQGVMCWTCRQSGHYAPQCPNRESFLWLPAPPGEGDFPYFQ